MTIFMFVGWYFWWNEI